MNAHFHYSSQGRGELSSLDLCLRVPGCLRVPSEDEGSLAAAERPFKEVLTNGGRRQVGAGDPLLACPRATALSQPLGPRVEVCAQTVCVLNTVGFLILVTGFPSPSPLFLHCLG